MVLGRADEAEQREKEDEDAKGDEAANQELVRANLTHRLEVRSSGDEERRQNLESGAE